MNDWRPSGASDEPNSYKGDELDAYTRAMANDLKNPLTVVAGYADFLVDSCACLQPEEVQEYSRRILLSTRKMASIIDGLLLLASARDEDPEMYPVEMGDVLAEALQRLEADLASHPAEIVSRRSWPRALGYGPWVEEVWCHYLQNAIKYAGQHDGCPRVPVRIELGATVQDDGCVRFWVSDNGCGIADEDQKRLFAPFGRLGRHYSEGHGLGLSLVKRIVERMQGQVGVESQPGQGSTFSFTLPAAPNSSSDG